MCCTSDQKVNAKSGLTNNLAILSCDKMSQLATSSIKSQKSNKRLGNEDHKDDFHTRDRFALAVFGAAFDGDVEELGLLLTPSKMISKDQLRDIVIYQDGEGNSLLHKCVHGAAVNTKEQHSAKFLDCCSLVLSLGVSIDFKDKYGRTALHWCVLYGRLDLLAFLHQAGCDFMVFDESGFSPLHFAIGIRSEKLRNEFIEYFCTLAPKELLEALDGQKRSPLFLALSIGALKVFQCLLYAKANPNGVGPDGRHLIIHAIEKGQGRFTELLLKYGASLSTNDPDNFSAIHLAACQENPQNIFVLTELVNKTLLNVKDHLGRTPLMYACLMGFDKNVELLLSRKIWVLDVDNDGKTALHHTVNNTHCGCVDLLCKSNPKIVDLPGQLGHTAAHDAVIAGNSIILNALLQHRANVNAIDNGGHTLVHWATAYGTLNCLKILLEYDVLFEETDNHGATPLHYGCQKDSKEDLNIARIEVLNILLSNGAKMCNADKEGRQPIHWAASSGNIDALKVLINYGVNINTTTSQEEMTALHLASFQGLSDVVDFLVNQSDIMSDPNDRLGCTPLFYACASGHSCITEKLLKSGANPKSHSEDGETPCHCAASAGSVECLELLLKFGAALSCTNAQDDTPLHEASSSGKPDAVQFLLDNGCQSTVHNRSGATPLHYAVAERHSNVTKLLLQRNAKVNALVVTNNTNYVTPLDIALGNNDLPSIQLLQQYGARTGHSIAENSALIIQHRWRVYVRRYCRAESSLKSDLSDSVSTNENKTGNESRNETPKSSAESKETESSIAGANCRSNDCNPKATSDELRDLIKDEHHQIEENSSPEDNIESRIKECSSLFDMRSTTTELVSDDVQPTTDNNISIRDASCSYNITSRDHSNMMDDMDALTKSALDQIAASKAECRRSDALMDRAERLKKKIEMVLQETKEIRSSKDFLLIREFNERLEKRQAKMRPVLSLPDIT